eukprot:869618-Amphidinium_carterae.1
MDTDCGPTLEDTLTDDAIPSPEGTAEAPPTEGATHAASDPPRARARTTCDDDEAPLLQPVLPAAIQLTRVAGGE